MNEIRFNFNQSNNSTENFPKYFNHKVSSQLHNIQSFSNQFVNNNLSSIKEDKIMVDLPYEEVVTQKENNAIDKIKIEVLDDQEGSLILEEGFPNPPESFGSLLETKNTLALSNDVQNSFVDKKKVTKSHEINSFNNNYNITKQDLGNLFCEVKEIIDTTNQNNIICSICYNDIQNHLIVKLSQCSHEFCQNCLKTYINNSISQNILDIRCPYDQCQEYIEEKIIKEYLSSSRYEDYLRYKLNNEMAKNSDIRWCPRKECGKWIKVSKPTLEVKCQCGQLICYNCGESLHFGKTCQQRLYQDLKLYALHGKVKMCPKCKSRTEKLTGCNHMTCSRCKFEYCWRCLDEFKNLHMCRSDRIGKCAYLWLLLSNICTFAFLMLFSVPIFLLSGMFYALTLHFAIIFIVPGAVVKNLLQLKESSKWFNILLCFICGICLSPLLIVGFILCNFFCCFERRLKEIDKDIKKYYLKAIPRLSNNNDEDSIAGIRVGFIFSLVIYFLCFLFLMKNYF